MSTLDLFPKAYVINLPHRADRRRETRAMFERIGLADWEQRVEFFPAVKPESQGDFPSLGARGCFLSHVGVLKRAIEEGADGVLIMEDDLEIAPDFVLRGAEIAETLRRQPWGFAYFGHVLGDGGDPAGEPLRTYEGRIQTTHFLAVAGAILPRVVEFLEAVYNRPLGHPDGGPMHVDGAYSLFRERNPDVLTLVAMPNLGSQRESSSDVSTRWFDKVPGLGSMAKVARKIKRRARR